MLGYVAVKLTNRLSATAGVEGVARLDAVYRRPGEVLVAADLQMNPALTGADVIAALARIRDDAARDLPLIARLYLTPVWADGAQAAGSGGSTSS